MFYLAFSGDGHTLLSAASNEMHGEGEVSLWVANTGEFELPIQNPPRTKGVVHSNGQ